MSTCPDYRLKGMIPIALNGNHVLETNVVGDTSPLGFDENASYTEGNGCIFGHGIWDRTSHDLSITPVPKPGRILGKWIEVSTVNYTSFSVYYSANSTALFKNAYTHRPLTNPEADANTGMRYARWQVLRVLVTPAPALPALEVSTADYQWIGYSFSAYHYTERWNPDTAFYSAGKTVWVPDHATNDQWRGAGFIANENIIRDSANPYLNEPRKVSTEQSDRPYWVQRDEDNQYRLFNLRPGSVTTAPEEITYKLLLEEDFKEIGFDGAIADEIEVIATDILEVETFYHETHKMVQKAGNKYDYLFNQNLPKYQLLIEGMPRRGRGILTIKIKKPGGIAQLGNLSVGVFHELGHLTSVGSGGFGDDTFSLGSYSHRIETPIGHYDKTVKFLNKLREASAQKRPCFFKATGFLESAWGGAYLEDFMLLHNNNGLERAETNLDMREVV